MAIPRSIRILFAPPLLLLSAGCVGRNFNPCPMPTENPECGAYSRQLIAAKFGAESAEEIADRDEQARRIYYVNAFGRGILGTTFLRGPDGKAEVRVDLPRLPGTWRVQPAPIRAIISNEIWTRALAATSDLRPIKPKPDGPTEPGTIVVCADGWLYVVEIVEGRDRPVRRAMRSSCGDERLSKVRDALAAIARSEFPPCAMLDHEFEIFALQDCGALGGDRNSAAEALNRFNALHGVSAREWAADKIGPYLAEDATLIWNGSQARGRQDFVRSWTQIPATTTASWLEIDTVVGESGDRVVITGFAIGYIRAANGQSDRAHAPFSQTWKRTGAEPFVLTAAEVGPWTVDVRRD